MSDPREGFNPTSLEEYQVEEETEVESFEEEVDEEVDSEELTEEEGDYTEPSEEVEEEVEEEYSTQTPEQNAYYAEQRRQSIVEQRVQQELERLKQQAPEFQMAQMLSQMYGVPVDQLHQQLQEAALQKRAEEQGVPVEIMRQLNAYEQQQFQLQEQLNQMQFESWKNKVDTEGNSMLQQYPMLNEQDILEAQYYLLDTLQNPEIPLQNAVFALHGDKIASSLKELAKQEALAEISGRKKGGLPPQSMKTNSDENYLTAEERYVAKMMGISEADYIKHKS
jgi:hypothetical protein